MHNSMSIGGPVAEFGSNLYEIRNRIQMLTDTIRVQNQRLRAKNRQLLSLDDPSKGGSGALEGASRAEQMPLIAEVNYSLLELEREIGLLSTIIDITETI